MTSKINSIFQMGKCRREARQIRREELLDRMFDSCISIQAYINSMDSQLDLYLAKAKQAQHSCNKRELSFAYANIRTALTQKRIAEIMYDNLSQIRSQVKLNSLIQTFSCDVSAMAELCKGLSGNLNIKKVMRDYNEIMHPLEASSLKFDYFNESLIRSMSEASYGDMGISDAEIASMIESQSVSPSAASKTAYTTASYPGDDAKGKSKETDSLRERLNRF